MDTAAAGIGVCVGTFGSFSQSPPPQLLTARELAALLLEVNAPPRVLSCPAPRGASAASGVRDVLMVKRTENSCGPTTAPRAASTPATSPAVMETLAMSPTEMLPTHSPRPTAAAAASPPAVSREGGKPMLALRLRVGAGAGMCNSKRELSANSVHTRASQRLVSPFQYSTGVERSTLRLHAEDEAAHDTT